MEKPKKLKLKIMDEEGNPLGYVIGKFDGMVYSQTAHSCDDKFSISLDNAYWTLKKEFIDYMFTLKPKKKLKRKKK